MELVRINNSLVFREMLSICPAYEVPGWRICSTYLEDTRYAEAG